MDHRRGIQVVLRSAGGKYLAGHQQAWTLTDDLRDARVFDFEGDRILEQLERLRRDHGVHLGAVPVDTSDRQEVCDGCGRPFPASRIFFDGARFLCAPCHERGHETGAQKG